jgi:hypothetical protein
VISSERQSHMVVATSMIVGVVDGQAFPGGYSHAVC